MDLIRCVPASGARWVRVKNNVINTNDQADLARIAQVQAQGRATNGGRFDADLFRSPKELEEKRYATAKARKDKEEQEAADILDRRQKIARDDQELARIANDRRDKAAKDADAQAERDTMLAIMKDQQSSIAQQDPEDPNSEYYYTEDDIRKRDTYFKSLAAMQADPKWNKDPVGSARAVKVVMDQLKEIKAKKRQKAEKNFTQYDDDMGNRWQVDSATGQETIIRQAKPPKEEKPKALTPQQRISLRKDLREELRDELGLPANAVVPANVLKERFDKEVAMAEGTYVAPTLQSPIASPDEAAQIKEQLLIWKKNGVSDADARQMLAEWVESKGM